MREKDDVLCERGRALALRGYLGLCSPVEGGNKAYLQGVYDALGWACEAHYKEPCSDLDRRKLERRKEEV